MRFIGGLLLVLALVCTSVQAQPGTGLDSLVRPLLEGHSERAIVVGFVEADGARQVLGFGTVRPGADAPPDAHTLFEIGSVTKGFTGLLLAEMVQRGEVQETDPVEALLPDTVVVSTYEGRAIILRDLATHTSALPRLPLNLFAFENPSDPYAAYTVEDLYDFLNAYSLRRAPGTEYRYSNLGMGLLSHALARQAGTSYEALLRMRILQPLGLGETCITLDEEAAERFVQGYQADGTRQSPWHLPALAGAGALRSTADDLLTLLHAFLTRNPETPLGRVLNSAIQPRAEAGSDSLHIGLGWHLKQTPEGEPFVFHNGATGGYSSFVGFSDTTGTGVVILANASISLAVDALGFALLRNVGL